MLHTHIYFCDREKKATRVNKTKLKRKLNGIFSSLSFLTDATGNEKYLSLSKNVVSFPSSLVSLSPWISTTFQGIFLQNPELSFEYQSVEREGGFFSTGRMAPRESKVTLAGRRWTRAKLQGSLDKTALLHRRSGEQTALLSAEHN